MNSDEYLRLKNVDELSKLDIKNIKIIFFDFDGVFTDNKVLVSENGQESVFCSRADGIGLKKLNNLGFKLFVISTEKNKVVKERCRKLNIECFNGVENKAIKIKEILSFNNLKKENALFLGNDINDIEAFKVVGLKITVFDRIKSIDPYIDFVTNKSGGNGAVREVCDKISDLRKTI